MTSPNQVRAANPLLAQLATVTAVAFGFSP